MLCKLFVGAKWGVLDTGLTHAGCSGTGYEPTWEHLLHGGHETLPPCPVSLSHLSAMAPAFLQSHPWGLPTSSQPLTPTQPSCVRIFIVFRTGPRKPFLLVSNYR